MKQNCFHWIAIILFISFYHQSFAQKNPVTIEGKIVDIKTKKPISNANIFLSGTTIGATTNTQGKYRIHDSIPAGNYTLVSSHIKYQVATKGLFISTQRNIEINFELSVQEKILDEVIVKSKRDRAWRKQFRRFKREFLGSSSLGRNCKVVNPWVIEFQEKDDTLFASSIKEVVIENPKLGYRIYCNLKNFSNVRFFTNYLGLYRFEALKPKNKKQQRKWLKARVRAFKGSFQHFACALMYNRLSKEGFFMNYSKKSPAKSFDIQPNPLKIKQVLKGNKIEFPHYIQVMYSEREPTEYINWLTKQNQKLNPIARANLDLSRNSWIKIRGKSLRLSDLGMVMDDPYKLQISGYWAWERVGNMLPSNFIPNQLMQAIKLSKIQTVKQLTTYTKRRPQEKVYLHQSKSFYFVRDTLWLSSYIVDAHTHKPSNLSKVVYVELIDEHQQIKKRLSLKNNGGRAQGRFILEDFLKPGKYRLRAYTKLMEGADPEYFFNQFFEIGDMGLDPIDVKFSYQNQTKNKSEQVAYELQLLRDNKKLLAGKKVQLLVKAGQKTYKTLTLRTDSQGKIKGSIPVDINEKYPYLEIMAKSPKTRNKKKAFQKSFFIPIKQHKTSIQFFPEGGDLIAGLSNQIAFKAVNNQGWGVDVKGYIINDKKEKVAEFQSMHQGMGKFSFVPNRKQSYTAIITNKDGGQQQTALPKVIQKGFLLTVNQNLKDFLIIKMSGNFNTQQKFTLIAHNRGKPVYTYSDKVKKRKASTIKIAKNTLPTGMILFTLFDKNFQPRCERLVFINNNNLQVKFTTNKANYSPREKVEINLNVKSKLFDTTATSLSMSVVSEELSTPVKNQTNILSNLLLTSDLKGFIENPGFYFKDKSFATRQALDLLMMTQGWRRFTWNKVLNDTTKTLNFKPEQGFTFSGKVTTKTGESIAHGKVILVAPQSNVSRFTTTNEEGRFTFDSLYLSKSNKVLIRATNARGKANNIKVKLDENHQPFKVKTYQPYNQFIASINGKSSTIQDYLIKKLQNKDILEEVTVTAKKNPPKFPKRRPGQLYSEPSYGLNLENLDHYGGSANLLDYINTQIPAVNVAYKTSDGILEPKIAIREAAAVPVTPPPPPSQMDPTADDNMNMPNIEGPLIMLDGMPVNIAILQDIPLEDVAQVDVLGSGRAAIYGSRGYFGALLVYTKDGRTPPKPAEQKDIINLVFNKGYHESRQFYVPSYGKSDFSKNKLPDYRTTVYWNPNIQAKNGEAKVSFYTSDNPGSYRVIVEGLSKQGEVTRKEFFYEVKKKE